MTRTWADKQALFRVSDPLRNFNRRLPNRRELHDDGLAGKPGNWRILTTVGTEAVELLLAYGPETARTALEQIAPMVIPALDRREEGFGADARQSTAVLAMASSVCMFEVLGIDLGEDLLPRLRPKLVQIPTTRNDEFVYQHWNRALIALALDDRCTWGPIAGLLPGDPIPFTAKATFEFNMQGLIAHLAGAIAHGAPRSDVDPAWRDFLRCYPVLEEAGAANLETLLWVGRLVMHHVDGSPGLGKVGELLYLAVKWAQEQG